MQNKNFVIFGAGGNLSVNYLFPALSQLRQAGLGFNYVGYGRTSFSPPQFSDLVASSTQDRELASEFKYVTGDYQPQELSKLKAALLFSDSIFYLALPIHTSLVHRIISGLVENKLFSPSSRLVVEKPFGTDYPSAKQLSKFLHATIGEDRVFLVDHFLTKELVKNIISLRFANSIFSGIWNRKFIEEIHITLNESEGIADRGRYYDSAGALKDMVQNHLLQLLSLVTMDQPENLATPNFAHEKVKILHRLRLYSADSSHPVRLGQYRGFREEKYISPTSQTETFAHLVVEIDHPKWRGIPIHLQTGKKMPEKLTEIRIVFKNQDRCLWDDCGKLAHNELIINLHPRNDIRLTVNHEFNPSQKLPKPITFPLGDLQETETFKSAYENILMDIVRDIKINSPSFSEILYQWKFIDSLASDPRLPQLEIY